MRSAMILLMLTSVALVAQAADTPAHTLPPLPYAVDALEPVVDAETMRVHHTLHHQAYVNGLNAAIAADPSLAGKPLGELLTNVSERAPAIRNHGGGHYNHTLFWTLMAPAGSGGEPSPELLARITQDFGSLSDMKKAFETAGATRFGSGWAWLVWTGEALAVTSTANQDNPLMDVAEVRGRPILANDVWEHAYYLRYQNKRGSYLSEWWKIVNWNEVNRLFAEASAKP